MVVGVQVKIWSLSCSCLHDGKNVGQKMPSIGMYAMRSKPLQYIGMAHVAISIINFYGLIK